MRGALLALGVLCACALAVGQVVTADVPQSEQDALSAASAAVASAEQAASSLPPTAPSQPRPSLRNPRHHRRRRQQTTLAAADSALEKTNPYHESLKRAMGLGHVKPLVVDSVQAFDDAMAAALSRSKGLQLPKAQCKVEDRDAQGVTKFALLVPSTTRNLNVESIDELPLFKYFIPTFGRTAEPSAKLKYYLYLGYDEGDKWYDNQMNLEALRAKLVSSNVGFGAGQIRLIKLQKGSLVELWNQLFQQAHADGAHYFYQIGDDIQFVTPGWGARMVHTLRSNPTLTNFGMVGPQDAVAPQTWAEQEAVSRLHMNVFGYLFDRKFRDVSCDVWLSQAYGKDNSFVIDDMKVKNVIRMKRYKIHPGDVHVMETVAKARAKSCLFVRQCLPKAKADAFCASVRQDRIVGVPEQKFRSMRFVSVDLFAPFRPSQFF